MERDSDPLLLKVPDAAKRLGIASSLAYQMVREGRLPSVRVGKRGVRVPWARLQVWIAERTREDR